jgi:phosphotransferase system HPr (HPr) family protein
MVQRVLTVDNPLGLHARAAARLVAAACRFQSRILFARPDRREQIDGKSILGILMLAASRGTRLLVTIEGADEAEALREIERLFATAFDEGADAS